MTGERRFYEATGSGPVRSAPAALRNRDPIAKVLADWLPREGKVLELASGTGEHVIHFACLFPGLRWQPSDVHPDALASISARLETAPAANILRPLRIDAGAVDWPVANLDAVCPTGKDVTGNVELFSAILCINMVHISPWNASIGLLEGSSRHLRRGGVLILYGPWLEANVPAEASNLQFDQQLRSRDPQWGLRHVEAFRMEASKRRFVLEETRPMPASNLMLLFRLHH